MKKIIIGTLSALLFAGCAIIPGLGSNYLFGSAKQLDASYDKTTGVWTVVATEPKTLTVSSKGAVTLLEGVCKTQEVDYSLTCPAPVKIAFKADGFSSTLTNDYGIVAGPLIKKAQ